MHESFKILIGLLLLAGFYVLTQYGISWRVRRAALFVIRDLQKRGATDAGSAVELSYARKRPLNIGMRDFRPGQLEQLLAKGFLGVTREGKYYLRKSFDETQYFGA